MFGSFISGFMVGDTKFKLGRAYGYALILESAALFLSFAFLKKELVVGEWFAAFACGLQNVLKRQKTTYCKALATTYSGAVVRTTHMTGVCTDIANTLGQYCRKDSNAELWRLKVLVPILVGYCLGGIFGQIAFLGMKENALLLPCFFVGSIGVTYLTLPFIRKATKDLKKSEQNNYQNITEVVEIKRNEEAKNIRYTNYADVDTDTMDFMKDLERKGSLKGTSDRPRASKVSFEDIEIQTVNSSGHMFSPRL